METLRTYVSLRSAVRRSLGEVMSDGGAERVAWYKRIGEMIDLHVLLRADRADYGGEVIQRLANDLEVRNQRLYEMLNVHRAFPISRPGGKLMWAHYVALSRIEDEGVRAARRKLFAGHGAGRCFAIGSKRACFRTRMGG